MLKLYVLLFVILPVNRAEGAKMGMLELLEPYLDDEMVTFDELLEASMSYLETEDPDKAKGVAVYGMKIMDVDQDGVLNRQEVAAHYSKLFGRN